MSRCEQLRGELERMKQEAAERERARLAAERKADMQKALQLIQNHEAERQTEENWQIVKPQIIALYKDLNEKVFDSSGKIVNWHDNTLRYTEKWEERGQSDGEGGSHESYRRSSTTSFKTQSAELIIKGVGKVLAARTYSRVLIGGIVDERIPLDESNSDEFSLSGELPGDFRQELEETFAKQIRSLVQKSYGEPHYH